MCLWILFNLLNYSMIHKRLTHFKKRLWAEILASQTSGREKERIQVQNAQRNNMSECQNFYDHKVFWERHRLSLMCKGDYFFKKKDSEGEIKSHKIKHVKALYPIKEWSTCVMLDFKTSTNFYLSPMVFHYFAITVSNRYLTPIHHVC